MAFETSERGSFQKKEPESVFDKISAMQSAATPNDSVYPKIQTSQLLVEDRQGRQTGSGVDVLFGAIKELPDATAKLAADAWKNPGDFLSNSVKTLGESAAIGTAMGLLIPSRSVAAGLATIAFSAPIALGTYRRIDDAYSSGNKLGADTNALSKALAGDLIHEGYDFALGSLGAFAGASLGHRLATSDTLVGDFAQRAQRMTLKTENAGMIGLASAPDMFKAPLPKAAVTDLSSAPFAGAWFLPRNSALNTRLALATAAPKEFSLRMGSLHGHSYYSDGMGTPAEIFAKAKADGMDFYAITDHNHLAARQGVGSDDPRSADQAKVPIIASMPSEYTATLADAAAATVPGKFVGIVGVEMGTIGHVGGGHGGGADGGSSLQANSAPAGSIKIDAHNSEAHTGHNHSLPEEFAHMQVPDNLPAPTIIRRVHEPDGTILEHKHTLPQEAAAQAYREQAYLNSRQPVQVRALTETPVLSPRDQALADADGRDKGHYSGINHVNVFEFPQMIIADRAGDTNPKAAGAIHYDDGDFNGLIKKIGNSTDTTGGIAVWQLNHPRYVADNNPNLPANLRGRDYGTKSFPSQDAWLQAMDPRVHQVEVITGEALNPDPIDVMKPHDLGPINMAGYIDKGLHVSPTYGRDDHFALPGGRPAGTGILADTLDKTSLMNGLRNRQTIATTSTELLSGYMLADNHPMGAILDQNAINDLNISMFVGGKVEPAAEYKVNLWSDPKIGDGNLATMVQSKSLSGQEILDANGQVKFDQAQHKIGNKSAWYVEVQRTDPKTSNTDYMWTAPIWVEPLDGALGHSLMTRVLIGAGSTYLLGGDR